MKLLIKVLCGQCGTKIGEGYGDEVVERWRPVWEYEGAATAKPSRADSVPSPMFWCLQHGWTDPSEVTAAAERGTVTLRAHVGAKRE